MRSRYCRTIAVQSLELLVSTRYSLHHCDTWTLHFARPLPWSQVAFFFLIDVFVGSDLAKIGGHFLCKMDVCRYQLFFNAQTSWVVVSRIVLCSPRSLGKWSNFDEHIFRMGWFNNQLVKDTQKEDNNDGNLRGPHTPQTNKALLRDYSGTVMVKKPLTRPATPFFKKPFKHGNLICANEIDCHRPGVLTGPMAKAILVRGSYPKCSKCMESFA